MLGDSRSALENVIQTPPGSVSGDTGPGDQPPCWEAARCGKTREVVEAMAPARVPANAQQTQGRGTRGGSAMSLTAALTHPARCRASGSHPLPRVRWLVPALWPSGNPRGHVPAQATCSAQRGLLFSQPRPCPAPTQASRLPAAKIPPRRASHRLAGTCLPSISHPVSMPGSLCSWTAVAQRAPGKAKEGWPSLWRSDRTRLPEHRLVICPQWQSRECPGDRGDSAQGSAHGQAGRRRCPFFRSSQNLDRGAPGPVGGTGPWGWAPPARGASRLGLCQARGTCFRCDSRSQCPCTVLQDSSPV
ncbi:uncharacterized protein LOC124079820 [Marmota monax]|uniref:uncharacterized protein LOC124079820 n=1 Tax=Marmota monax TaxID=9995 RepID=UPI001EAF96E9|nr:uncharacterized protein LOC124079820 [Marmota monax]XP_046281549.1 uncharacterized protein LOC124079820 [Marmota monax]XP_046281550.1 uncharacterized protein LOC124079820 [Marmota monax]XP_046281551.1 uncharacterized protein LOC124079820 [Marmota monax]XP_046281552.1 uncharacterized protein LOC124079820 [Marmota monax]XP_046281553.1 uncharacterized protein LOC124079820 [Marmota monax]XP_046281554.1 uncharacterized protein LOC124079820 [Marmota monax]XP_046281557.1 uncharacterized protein 